jgi:hypothetical protein
MQRMIIVNLLFTMRSEWTRAAFENGIFCCGNTAGAVSLSVRLSQL